MASEYSTCDDIFECRQCGDCCKGFGGTYVTQKDIKKICAYSDINPDTFISRYCDKSGSRYVLTRGDDGFCVFFENREQCTIHPVKPYMCRAWPFIQTIITNPENWNIMANSCPGMKKDIPFDALVKIVSAEKEKLDNDFNRND